MARLPIVGGDDGNWGEILNDYLVQSHAADGTLKTDSVGAPQLKPNAVTSAAIAPGAVTATSIQDDSIETAKLQDGAVSTAKIDKYGQANGVASLDGDARIPTAQVPDLSANYVPKWKANTAYAQGEAVLNPSGDTVTAKAAFTSGSSYSASDWNSSSLYSTKAGVFRANKMVLFGDSWEYYNFGDPAHPTRPSPGSRGYASNGNAQLGHRFDFINKGVGGEDTLALLARYQSDLVAVDAGWAMIGSGTNDITNGRTYNQITQNLATLYDAAAASGKRVVGRTIPPRTGQSASDKSLRSQVNQWIRGQAMTRPGFIVVDIEQAVMDPLTNDFVTGYSYDGVHLANPGGVAAGEMFANALRPFVPAPPILLAAADPRNLLANNGGGFPGAASAVPTGWTANGWSQGAPTYSKVARTDGIPGQWQQLVVPTDSRGFLRSTVLLQSGGAFTVGDTLRAAVEFQVENLEVAPTAATQAMYIVLEYYNGSTYTYRYDLEWNATDNENEGNRSRSGIMLTAPFTVPSGGSNQNLAMSIQARCGGTYRFARACVFKV
jgi:hypothetical protein